MKPSAAASGVRPQRHGCQGGCVLCRQPGGIQSVGIGSQVAFGPAAVQPCHIGQVRQLGRWPKVLQKGGKAVELRCHAPGLFVVAELGATNVWDMPNASVIRFEGEGTDTGGGGAIDLDLDAYVVQTGRF